MEMKTSARKGQKTTSRVKSCNVKPFKEMEILDHIERIYNITHECGIDNYQLKGKRHLDYIAKRLDISPLQSALFSHFLAQGDDNCIQISQIANSGNCSPIRILKYMNELEELEQKKLLRCSRNSMSVTYRIPNEVRNSLRKNEKYIAPDNAGLGIDKFFTVLEELFEERKRDELVFDTLTGEVQTLISKNMHLEFCRKAMSYKLDPDDFILLICFCHLFGNNSDDNIAACDFDFLYEDKSRIKGIIRSLSKGSHVLIESKFIEFNNNNGFVNNESWKLSDMAKKELLPELNLKTNDNYEKNLILFNDIKAKKMFYNSREKEEIETLISLLSEENYRKIQDRLDEKGMRKGFACLFSGSPGTGKTETAYQIARDTKRNIMMVDISQIKSCWYGESEKKMKEIFDTYRNAVDNSSLAPILLFNEADAIIGKRKEFTAASRAVDQAENTIQNIILQEMETLSGILIATTNLCQNMDSAFERRFLYKINFDRPSVESRKAIWNNLLPGLPEEQAIELSNKFDLSGGQIENIARKVEVNAIIQGCGLSKDTLIQYCRDEVHKSFSDTKKIGFAQ